MTATRRVTWLVTCLLSCWLLSTLWYSLKEAAASGQRIANAFRCPTHRHRGRHVSEPLVIQRLFWLRLLKPSEYDVRALEFNDLEQPSFCTFRRSAACRHVGNREMDGPEAEMAILGILITVVILPVSALAKWMNWLSRLGDFCDASRLNRIKRGSELSSGLNGRASQLKKPQIRWVSLGRTRWFELRTAMRWCRWAGGGLPNRARHACPARSTPRGGRRVAPRQCRLPRV